MLFQLIIVKILIQKPYLDLAEDENTTQSTQIHGTSMNKVPRHANRTPGCHTGVEIVLLFSIKKHQNEDAVFAPCTFAHSFWQPLVGQFWSHGNFIRISSFVLNSLRETAMQPCCTATTCALSDGAPSSRSPIRDKLCYETAPQTHWDAIQGCRSA